jgi:hypothetical protein
LEEVEAVVVVRQVTIEQAEVEELELLSPQLQILIKALHIMYR